MTISDTTSIGDVVNPRGKASGRIQLIIAGVIFVTVVRLRLWMLLGFLLATLACVAVLLALLFGSILLSMLPKNDIRGLIVMIKGPRCKIAQNEARFSSPDSWSTFFPHRCYRREFSWPPSISNPEIQKCLDNLIGRIRVVYIESWYSTMTKDTKFAHMAEERLRDIVIRVIDIILKQDIDTLVFSKILPIITAHLMEYKMAEKKYESSARNVHRLQIQRALLIPEFYPENRIHPALRLQKTASPNGYTPDTDVQECNYLRKLSEKLILGLLLENDSDCKPLLAILVEILSCSVIKFIVDTVSEPHFFYSNLEILLDNLNEREVISFVYSTLSRYFRLEKISLSLSGEQANEQVGRDSASKFKLPPDERLLSFVYIMDHVERSKNLFDIFFAHEEILAELRKIALIVLDVTKEIQSVPKDHSRVTADFNTLVRCLSIAHKKAMKKAYTLNNKTRNLIPFFLRQKSNRTDIRNRVLEILADKSSSDYTESGNLRDYVEFFRGVNDLRQSLNDIGNSLQDTSASRDYSPYLLSFSLSRYSPDISTTSSYYHVINGIVYDFLVLRNEIFSIPPFIYTECLLSLQFGRPVEKNLSARLTSVIKASKYIYDSYLSPNSRLLLHLTHALQCSISEIAPEIFPDTNDNAKTELLSGINLILFILAIEREITSHIARDHLFSVPKNVSRNNGPHIDVPKRGSQSHERPNWPRDLLPEEPPNGTLDLVIPESLVTSSASSPVQFTVPDTHQPRSKSNITITGLLSIGRKKLSVKRFKNNVPSIRTAHDTLPYTHEKSQVNSIDNRNTKSPDVNLCTITPPFSIDKSSSPSRENEYNIINYHQGDNCKFPSPPFLGNPRCPKVESSSSLRVCTKPYLAVGRNYSTSAAPSYPNADTPITGTPDHLEIQDNTADTNKKAVVGTHDLIPLSFGDEEYVVSASDNLKLMDLYLRSIEDEDIAICQCIKTLKDEENVGSVYTDLLNEQSFINAKLIKVKRARRLLLARELSEAISPGQISVCVDEIDSTYPIKNYEKITYSSMVTCFSPDNSMFSWRLYFSYQGVQAMLKSVELSLNDLRITLPSLKKPHLAIFKGAKNSPKKAVMSLGEFFDCMCANEFVCKNDHFRKFVCSREVLSLLQELLTKNWDSNHVIDSVFQYMAAQQTSTASSEGNADAHNPSNSSESLVDPGSLSKHDEGADDCYSSTASVYSESLVPGKPPAEYIGISKDDHKPEHSHAVASPGRLPASDSKTRCILDRFVMRNYDNDDLTEDMDTLIDTSNTPVYTTTASILNLLLELFNLRSRRNWVRRQVLAFILPQIIGSVLKRKSTQLIKSLATDDVIIHCINYVASLVSTEYYDHPAQSVSAEQRTKTLFRVRRTLTQVMNRSLAPIIGENNVRSASYLIWNTFQSKRLNSNIVYKMLDEISNVFLSANTSRAEHTWAYSKRKVIEAPSEEDDPHPFSTGLNKSISEG